MSSSFDRAVKDLVQIMTEPKKNKTSPYDTQAEVIRVDGDTAWVHIPGGVDETPVKLTMNAQAGDTVQVRVSGGNAWLQGNATSPPTDDTRANEAASMSEASMLAAENAIQNAIKANEAAGRAEISADKADNHANQAEKSANNAQQSADTAFKQLGIVEDIIGVLDLISKNGSYQLTQDPEPTADKWYFERIGTSPDYIYNVATLQNFYRLTGDTEIEEGKTYYARSGTAPDYVYTPVANPVVEDIDTYYEAFRNPSEQGLYELVGIDQSIQNYVSSHLVLAGNTLSLRTSGSPYRLDLTTTGMTIIGADGTPLATYGTDTIIGSQNGFHVKIDGTELGFYDKTGSKVAYVRNDQLFIERSVVVQQMDVGTKTIDGGLGQWSWKVHEINGQNNLYLKWLG